MRKKKHVVLQNTVVTLKHVRKAKLDHVHHCGIRYVKGTQIGATNIDKEVKHQENNIV